MPDEEVIKATPPPPPPPRVVLEQNPPEQKGDPYTYKVVKDIVIGVVVVLFIGFAGVFVAVGGVINDWLAQIHASNDVYMLQEAQTQQKVDAIYTALQKAKLISQ